MPWVYVHSAIYMKDLGQLEEGIRCSGAIYETYLL